MGVWGGSPCTAVTPTCTDKEAGSNGVGFSMDTRLLTGRPKGMNGLKILSSTRLLAQTNLPTRHQPSCRLRHRSDTQLGQLSHTRTLRAAGTLQGVPPSCCGRRVAVWSGPCLNGSSGFGEAATTRKQPANLAVEGAEEALSILPDYTPTVRPPPKRS